MVKIGDIIEHTVFDDETGQEKTIKMKVIDIKEIEGGGQVIVYQEVQE